MIFLFFFFNDTATTEIYTLSLHDALPISRATCRANVSRTAMPKCSTCDILNAWNCWTLSSACAPLCMRDRKSTRLNSSHLVISYAVFCLKKKKRHYLPQNLPHTNRSTVLR